MGKNEKKNDKYLAIRDVLREYSSFEHPMKMKDIERMLQRRGYDIKRHAISTAMDDMNVIELDDDCNYEEVRADYMGKNRETIYCRSRNERRTDYWIEGAITDAELGLLVDMVLSSKILTQEESQSLAERIVRLSGKELNDAMRYRVRVREQPYIEKEENAFSIAISEVAGKTYLIRKAIETQKKVKFTLNVYDYDEGKICLRRCGRNERVCSPYDLIMSNGRYYMLGGDEGAERYRLYRVDLMTELSITKDKSVKAKEAGISFEMDDISKFRRENLYMYVGEIKRVRFKIERDYFTQVVDWFGTDFDVVECESKYLTIQVKVSTNSFIYWILQYGCCTEVVECMGDESFRERVKLTLNEILQKYIESDKKNERA